MNESMAAGGKILRLAVVHWFPLEQYPPAMNLLDLFGADDSFDVRAFSTGIEVDPQYDHDRVTVSRTRFPHRSLGKLRRLICYVSFPLRTFLLLLWFRPQVVLYLEPHSALPVWLYCTCHRRCRLFIHYHEYRDPTHYRDKGMRLAAFCHRLEKRSLYERAEWISHTNTDRVRLFLNDLPVVLPEKTRTLANRPPSAWFAGNGVEWPTTSQTLKLVYVGAVSLSDTFIEPLVAWIKKQPGVTLDIFTNNADQATTEFLDNAADDQLTFHSSGVPYRQLVDVLPNYHVGLILYRGRTANYIFNAPNKLFEYLACKLDVWYPKQMDGVKPYATRNVTPRVFEIDFGLLQDLSLSELRSQRPAETRSEISCETELQPLLNAIRGLRPDPLAWRD